MVEKLYEEVSRSPAHRPGWDPARVASYTLAICVHTSTVALVAFALWLMIAVPNPVTVVVAVSAVLVAWAIRPRFGSLRTAPHARYREDAPVLFALLDRVAGELGSKPVHAVVASGAYNAAYTTVGWRRRRVLILGLPLWDVLPPQQKVALLGHELAHGVNGDSRHGMIVGTSLSTLGRLYQLWRPSPRDHRLNYFIDLFARLFQILLSAAVAAVLLLQNILTLRAGQRAEYVADALAARLASPSHAAGLLDTLVIAEATHVHTVQQHMLNDRRSDYWGDLRTALAALPESERERRRRAAAGQRLRVDESHPPTHLRIAALSTHSARPPAVRMTPAEEAAIRAELSADYVRIAHDLIDTARASLA